MCISKNVTLRNFMFAKKLHIVLRIVFVKTTGAIKGLIVIL